MTTVSLDESRDQPTPEPAAAPRPLPRARLIRGGGLALGGGLAAFLLMAHDARLRLGVPLGALCILVCAGGVLEILRALHPSETAVTASVDARELTRPAALTAGSAALVFLSVWSAVHAVLPQGVAGVLLAGGFIGFVAGLFALGVALGPMRLDEDGNARPLRQRHGFWLLVLMALLYFPALGIGSLTDPWETHFGEVAREILARDDWISLWWSWEGFFYSKPVLGLWAQAISMATFGVHVAPDQMLQGVAGRLAHPEWAVRLPFTLFAIAGNYLLYKGVSRWFGRRAALLGAIAVATSPHWFLVAHQSMTDMPYVAAIAATIGLVLLAVREDDATLAGRYEIRLGRRTLSVDLWHLVLGGLLFCVVPQILYLVSRNLELVLDPNTHGLFLPHLDQVHLGSGLGNCGEPGDVACSTSAPFSRFEPWEQALVWTGLLTGIVIICWRERRVKRLLYVGAWLLAGLSTMAKGPAGIVLPAASVFAWIALTRRWSELPRMALGVGPMILAVVVGPWFVAVLVRHGTPFTDELIFHDMFNRAFEHVHDTNSGADTSLVYYVQELGYGLFPWTALAPLGLFAWLRRDRKDGDDAALLLFLWFAFALALFTMMGTKFHHYILPAVPAAGMLTGIALDAFLAKTEDVDSHARVMLGAAAVAGALLLGLVARDLLATTDDAGRFMRMFAYRYDRGWPATFDIRTPIEVFTVIGAIILLVLVVPRARRIGAYAWLAFALAWGVWGLDSYLPKASYHWGQRAIMDAYYTHRASPDEPIVAYQMNWKGENFYTSNRIPQFGTPQVPAGTPKLSAWAQHEKEERQKQGQPAVVYFVTEHGRVAGLRGEIKPKELQELTTRDDSNQFVLVRTEL
jgi:4-amino-4-deoxy-L-arabinose transferase-like glycosyltransferase